MNRTVRRTAEAWLAHGRDAVIVTVIESRGARGCHAGTRMLVSEGQRVGTIGGGHLELQSICLAEEMLATRAVAARHVQFPLAPARGGASARLGFARLEPSQLAVWPEHEVLFHLQLFDGGHLGAALARILATVDCTVDWIEGDDAPQPITMPESDEPWPERIRRVRSTAPAEHVAIGPAGGFYLVMTQSQQLDLMIAEAILRRADFGYLGLLGSSTQRTQVARRMGQRGIASDSIARMTCPVGVEGISNKKPESMAIAIAAQLLQRCNR